MAHSSTATANTAHLAPATPDVIGRAEAYRSSLVSAMVQGPAAPPWVQQLNANIDAMRADITAIRADITAMQENIVELLQKSNEEPIILANSRAGNRERLYDPTQLQGSWAALLVRPEHRDDLLTMSIQDCMTAAMGLALPPLTPATTVREHRQQIAKRIGVSLY